jgi:hypothetical protein
MNTKQRVGLSLTGFAIWAAGTLLFRLIGSYFFETSVTEYWISVIGTGILIVLLSLGLLKGWQVEPEDWLQGAICIALPGMFSEIPILFGFSEIMNNMQPETAGRYAAFLFAGYGCLIGSAWLLSIKAGLQVIPGSK